tara:strand:- start:64 stop:426 length:363 start_codon:yes stop_codon:yes gene_type:complete
VIKLGFHWRFGVVQDASLSAPAASFNVDVPAGASSLVVNFTDTSSNTPTSWAWAVSGGGGGSSSFTNSTNANSQNPQITFVNSGAGNPANPPQNFDVVLEATNAAGTGTSGATTISVMPV